MLTNYKILSKMKKLTLLLTLSLILFNANINSQTISNVNIKNAKKVAKSFYFQNVQTFENKNWNDIELELISNSKFIEQSFYVFNINIDEGFVIVSSTNLVKPIIAYSFEGSFNIDNMPLGQETLLSNYAYQISLAQDGNKTTDIQNLELWSDLLNYSPKIKYKSKTTVGPLLLVNWDQNWPYNASCPEDEDSNDGHVFTGPCATSMVQVMKYYNWPEVGEDSITHLNWYNGGYGDITIDFSAQNYNWDNMPNQVTGEVNIEVAKINFHAGVAISTYWGTDGSGSHMDQIVDALQENFKYSNSIELLQKNDYTDSEWSAILISQLDEGKVMIYSGTSTTAGQAWNCDGYQGDYFHMNWGFGGSGNGFYLLDALYINNVNPDVNGNFNLEQDAIINIYPRDTYPQYCSGNTLINGTNGTFEDGSSNLVYQGNQSCTYIIEPDNESICVSSILIDFNSFDLAMGDTVFIYDGNSVLDPLIDCFTSDSDPNQNSIAGTSNALTILFTTDNDNNAQGWQIEYSTLEVPKPITYNVSASSNYCCSGFENINILLDNSEIGVRYELYESNVYTDIQQIGTGEMLSFENLGNGNYSILGINTTTDCSNQMLGNEIIEESPTYEYLTYETICHGDSILWRENWYFESGIYDNSFSSEFDCDSIYKLELTANPNYFIEENVEICENGIYEWQGNTYSEAGIYTAEYECINTGCDSIYQLDLSINYGYVFDDNETICAGEFFEWQGNIYTEEGSYTETYYTVNSGCDSIYNLNITVNPTPITVEVTSNPLDGILAVSSTGEISISTSIIGTDYWVTMGGELFNNVIAGDGNSISFGTNYPPGTYDMWSQNEFSCKLVQGSVTFVEDNGLNKIIANITFGTPPANFSSGEVVVSLYKLTTDYEMNDVINFIQELTLSNNGQVIFEDIEPGDYYLSSTLVYPNSYNVASHIYYQTALTHENAISISMSESNIFIASLHHPQLGNNEGSNSGGGIVGNGESKSDLTPLANMVVILEDNDTDEIIDVCVTRLNGEYNFPIIPDNTNIKMYVTNFEHQQWTPFIVLTSIGQHYALDFIVDGDEVYPYINSAIPIQYLEDVNIYPNPTSGILFIEADNITNISITNIEGKIILSKSINANNAELYLSNFSKGIYLMKIETNEGLRVEKIVLE